MTLKTITHKLKKNFVKIIWIALLVVTIVTTVSSGVIAAIYTLRN